MAANEKVSTRVEPIILAYLDDLAALGAYGKGRSGVVRRFIEIGIQTALEKDIIRKRNVADYPSEHTSDDESNSP